MLILAPMQGLTEVLFRRVYERHFPKALDYAVSPFLSLTHGTVASDEQLDDVLPENNVGSMRVVPQLLGKEKEEFVVMAEGLQKLGYDEVNWNIGCPMRRVAAKHRGSGILPFPDEIDEVLRYVTARVGVALSVKMRIGHRSGDESEGVIDVLNAYDLKSVTIHPRTGKQQYGGTPDLQRFGECLKRLRHKVIYNGDICTAEDYKAIEDRFGVHDVMIGRGVLYDPSLPLKIRGEECDSRQRAADMVQDLMDEIVRVFPADQPRVRKMKEYWCLAYRSLGVVESRARELLRLEGYEEFKKGVEQEVERLKVG